MDDVRCELRSRMYLIKRMEVFAKDLEKEVEEEKEARKSQIQKLCEYKDVKQAEKACQMGELTSEEYQEILDHLENGTAFAETIKTENVAALELFRELMEEQKREIEDLKKQESDENIIIFFDGGTMTPEDIAAEEEDQEEEQE